MKLKIYIDTNIYINSILNRDKNMSQDVLIFLENSDVRLYVNDISIVNIHYIIRKFIDKKAVIKELKSIRNEHILVSTDEEVIDNALESNFKDFEDGIQYFCAKKINADVILTDNKKDFIKSDIKTISANEFYDEFVKK